MNEDGKESESESIQQKTVETPEKDIATTPKVEMTTKSENSREQLSELREDIEEEVEEENLEATVADPTDISVAKAKNKLADFDESKEKYIKFKEEKGISVVEKKMSKTQAWVEAINVNIKRLRGDIQRRKEVKRQIKSGEMKLESVNLQVEVMDRNALIEDPRIQALWDIEGNREILTNFTEKELYQEVNATHWLMLTGASVEQVHGIVDGMGHNPDAFLSGDRGENGGRIVIDNYEEDMPIDESDPRYEDEKKYWEPLFTNKLLPEGIRKWHMSRNHSVIYSVKDAGGNDIMMLPIHIDPKNWVVSIKEIFNPPKKGERSALDYHGLAASQKRYLGTGLYEDGVYQFINLLEKKQPGLFGKLEVVGKEKLDTTGTISGDEQNSMILEKVFKDKTNS